MMNSRQLLVCAGALFADGFRADQIAIALDTNPQHAQSLIERASEEQADGTMGRMRNCPAGDHRVVSGRDDNGNPTGSVWRR